MRLAPILTLLALAAAADAKPISPVSSPWSMCGQAPSWTKLEKCLERLGAVDFVRAFEHLKVMTVGENPMYESSPGLYVYMQQRSSIRLVWMSHYTAGANVEILGVRKVSVAGKSGYRLDIGTLEPSLVMLDDQTSLAAILRRKTATFCLGADISCTNVIESCEVLVDGKAYYAFRGTLALDGGTAVVSGDRSHAGMCTTLERTPLVSGAR